MTTAAKPTYFPARGGTGRTESDLGSLSKQYSSRDLPSHTKIKYRQDGQGSSAELKSKDFKRELEEKERMAREKKHQLVRREKDEMPGKRQKSEPAPLALLDADDPTVNDDDEDEEEEDDDDEDEGDNLEMELNKIRKEREAEKAKREEERKAEEERVRIENILSGNPLLNSGGPADFTVKRRWDDDVVFKNCAREEDSKRPRHYINDTLRSEFHKKFMDKYIK